MVFKLHCKICGDEHKATSKHFPIALYERREVFEGKGKNKKSLGIRPVLVGYACSKCIQKHELSQFIKEHNIKPGSGQRLMDAVRKKAEELKLKRIPVNRIKPTQEKPRFWQRLKDRFPIRTRIKKEAK